MLASKVLQKNKNKKETKKNLLSMMALPVIQSCSRTSKVDVIMG
jgi:hypothetical protein